MKLLKILCPVLLLGSPVLVASSLRADRVAFTPAKDSAVSKTLRLKLEFDVEDLYVSIGGQEMPPEMIGAGDDMSFSGDMKVGVTEKYIDSANGRPLELLRTYDSLSLEMVGGGESTDVEEFAELEGETVKFKWNSDDEEYVVTFEESELDEELLDALSDDMDLRVLLPADEVSKGDSWEVEAKQLYPFFLPGGVVSSSPGEEAEFAEIIEEEVLSQLEDLAEDFSVICRYMGSREIEGDKVGEIGFEFSGDGSFDLGEILLEAMQAQQELPATPDVIADLSMEMSGTGTLLWSLAKGHLYSFEMNGDLDLTFDMEVNMSVEGQDFDFKVNAEVSGKADWNLETD